MDRTFTTSEGRVLRLNIVGQVFIQKALLAIEKEFKSQNEPIDAPFYWAISPDEDGSGGERIQWDKASVERDGDEADKKAWADHEDAVKRLTAAKERRSTEALLLKGLDESDRKPDPSWVKEQTEVWGIELPSDPRELSIEYLTTEILKTPADTIGIISKLTAISLDGVIDQEDMEAIQASFRRALAETGKQRVREATKGNQGGASEEERGQAGVDIQHGPFGNENGTGLGGDPVPVGQALLGRSTKDDGNSAN